MNQVLGWLVCVCVLVAFAIFDLLLMFVLGTRNDFWAGVVLGVVFAQITVLAAWTALGPLPVVARGFVGLILASFVLAAVGAFTFRSTSGSEALPITLAVGAQWFVVQVPLWTLRLTLGLRIRQLQAERSESEPGGSRHSESQFGLGQLLVWTMLVSIVLGVARLALPTNSAMTAAANYSSQPFLAILVLLSVFNSLLAWPLIWGTLAPRRWVLWLALVPICGVALSLAEIWAFRTTLGPASFAIFCWLNGSHYLAAGIALLAVRVRGYRLTRADPPVAAADAVPTESTR